MDTKTKRAAALGYGPAFLNILPVADGTISIEDAGQALGAYWFDMPAAIPPYSVGELARTLASCRLGGTLQRQHGGTLTATYPFGTITRS